MHLAMLFPTLVLLVLLAVPGTLAVQGTPSSLITVPTTIEASLNWPTYIPAFEVRAKESQLSELKVHAGDDTSDPLRPTRVRSALDAFAPLNGPTDVPLRALKQVLSGSRTLTNAQRLANGLPPLSPRRTRQRVRAHPPRQSPTPCTDPTGTIKMTIATSGVLRGTVSETANEYGEYGLGPQGTSPLEVVLRRCGKHSGVPFEIETLNGLADFTFFGGIVGFASTDDNISDANANYVYIGGTTEVSPGPAQAAPNAYSAASGTARDVESALWTLGADGALTMNWVNVDGALAQGAHIVYVEHADALTLTGNIELFREQFGPAQEVVLTFVPKTGDSL